MADEKDVGEQTEDPEPEGVQEVSGKRMVDVSVLASERKRIRGVERAAAEQQLGPLRQQAADAANLRAALEQAKPYIDLVKQHPELLTPKEPTKGEAAISDEDALLEARDLELFEAGTGAPDVKRAKRIIAKRREESMKMATAAAQAVVTPFAQSSATQLSKQNFAQMAMLRDTQGRPLVDPAILAEEWVKLPPDLTQHPNVAETVLNSAIGRMHRAGKAPPEAPRFDPVFSEPSGGRGGSEAPLSTLEKKLGLTDADIKAVAGKYRPGGVSVIGE